MGGVGGSGPGQVVGSGGRVVWPDKMGIRLSSGLNWAEAESSKNIDAYHVTYVLPPPLIPCIVLIEITKRNEVE